MSKIIPLNIISKVVANYFECSQLDVFNNSRVKNIIIRRQWFQYLARTLNPNYKVSNVEIGSYYSDITGVSFSNAVVINNVKTIKGFTESYSEYRQLELMFVIDIKRIARVDDLEISKTTIFKPSNELLLCAQHKYTIHRLSMRKTA